MLNKLRARMQDEKGFTLIELLVVILIIGILAAIALPAFLNQREKAQDASAKSDARTAQTAMETYYTDHQAYDTADVPGLVKIEPALGGVNDLKIDAKTASSYTISVLSKGADATRFTITNTGGIVPRGCTTASFGKGGCPDDGKW